LRHVRNLVLFALSLTIPAAYAAEVGVRQVRENEYEFVLTNPTPLSEEVAQSVIGQVAAGVCKDLMPVLGKYRFESRQAIEPKAGSSEPDTFRFNQEVSCVPGTASPPEPRLPTLSTPEESQRVQDDIRLKSEAWFRLIADKRVDEAFEQMSAGSHGGDEAGWKRDTLSFQATAGKPVKIAIVKMTVYDNPAGAPKPGLYVAADFNNVYENVPIHCGYLMWFRPVGGDFLISRTEIGLITAEQFKSIPSVQLPEIKQQLRCVEP